MSETAHPHGHAGGNGSHAGHRHHGADPAKLDPNKIARDPVCGMSVNPETSRHRFDYNGATYHFCCNGCRTKFEADPLKYLNRSKPEAPKVPVAEGAIFTRQPLGPFAALRVIDPKSVESYYDIDGDEWPGAAREDMWRGILTASPGPQNIDIVLWLTRLIGNAPGPQFESPWGICGVHYGMGEAKGCVNPMGRVNWRW